MANNPEYIISFMAITSMGAVCVLLNSWWVPSEISYGLENSAASILIGDQKRLQGLEKFTELIRSLRFDIKHEKIEKGNEVITFEKNDEYYKVLFKKQLINKREKLMSLKSIFIHFCF